MNAYKAKLVTKNHIIKAVRDAGHSFTASTFDNYLNLKILYPRSAVADGTKSHESLYNPRNIDIILELKRLLKEGHKLPTLVRRFRSAKDFWASRTPDEIVAQLCDVDLYFHHIRIVYTLYGGDSVVIWESVKKSADEPFVLCKLRGLEITRDELENAENAKLLAKIPLSNERFDAEIKAEKQRRRLTKIEQDFSFLRLLFEKLETEELI